MSVTRNENLQKQLSEWVSSVDLCLSKEIATQERRDAINAFVRTFVPKGTKLPFASAV